MVLEFKGTPIENLTTLMRRIGYAPHYDRFKKEMTYAKKIQGTMFPRFHINVWKHRDTYIKLNLHLDAKRESYKGVSMHSGEYDTDVVVREGNRIKSVLQPLFSVQSSSANTSSRQISSSEKQGLVGRLMDWLRGEN